MGYFEYLRSSAWKKKRQEVITRAKGICERCKRWAVVNVHHLNYDRVENERLEDLLGVCAKCHKELHGKDVNEQ